MKGIEKNDKKKTYNSRFCDRHGSHGHVWMQERRYG